MEMIELGGLSTEERAELEGDEADPFDAQRIGMTLSWRAKDMHVALRSPEGRLVASAGLLLAEVDAGDERSIPVVGIGGVIVAAAHRGQGLANQVIMGALRRASRLGPAFALLFCYRDRMGLYQRHGFTEIPPPVMAQQPGGLVEMPMVAMWRALRAGARLPSGPVVLTGFPF